MLLDFLDTSVFVSATATLADAAADPPCRERMYSSNEGAAVMDFLESDGSTFGAGFLVTPSSALGAAALAGFETEDDAIPRDLIYSSNEGADVIDLRESASFRGVGSRVTASFRINFEFFCTGTLKAAPQDSKPRVRSTFTGDGLMFT